MPVTGMKLNFGMFFGTDMIFKRNFVNSVFYPLAVLGTIFFVSFALISYAIIESGVESAMEEQLNANAEVFASSIRENITSGIESEVFRKCNSYAKNKNLKSIIVKSSDGRKICDIDKTEGRSVFQASKNLYFDEEEKQLAAQVVLGFADHISGNLLVKSIVVLFLALVLLIVAYFVLGKYFVKENIKSVSELAFELSNGNISALKNVSKKLKKNSVEEITQLYEGVEEQAKKVELYHEELVEAAQWKAASELSGLVAHDIKSPLSNIEMIAEDQENDPMVRRMLKNSVSRIYEMLDEVIANGQYQQKSGEDSTQLISVEKLVSEQIEIAKYATESSTNITIDYSVGENGRFDVLLSPMRFKRALANLIKNSREAIGESTGKIKVSVYSTDSVIKIIVQDDGVGIEKEKVELLGIKGTTLGKEGGTGYGLYQVKEMLKSCGGDLTIDSEKNSGMTVTMKIPQYDAFTKVSEICIAPTDTVVVVDDEEITYKRWVQKFKKMNLSNSVKYFSSPEEFEEWAKNDGTPKLSTTVALFDYDLKSTQNGLDLLNSHKMKKKYLVTGDNRNVDVIIGCRDKNIGLIPKTKLSSLKLSQNNPQNKEISVAQI